MEESMKGRTNQEYLRDEPAGLPLVRDRRAGITLFVKSPRCLPIVFDFPRPLWYGSVCKDPTIL